jgi:tartrate dehydratase alpha subunit/fumarate hydratase class I-like protein
MGTSTGAGDLDKIRYAVITTSLSQGTNVCPPVFLIKIYGQKITGTVPQQRI